MSNYSELLKDPRWQKRRLEIFNRDEWKCVECGTITETLHVHHKKYVYGKMPWEAPDEDLITYCEGCHDLEESLKRDNVDNAEYVEASGITNIVAWKIVATMTYCRIHHPKIYQEVADRLSSVTLGLPKGSKERENFYAHLINPRRKG